MDIYQETLLMIRNQSKRLDALDDGRLFRLYSDWSKMMTSTEFLVPSPHFIAAFCVWATTAPCDL